MPALARQEKKYKTIYDFKVFENVYGTRLLIVMIKGKKKP